MAGDGSREMISKSSAEIKKYALDRDRQVLWASILWVGLTAAAVTIFVLGALSVYRGLREPCAMLVAQAREVCLERGESLAELGIPIDLYAAFLSAGAIVQALPWIVIGVLIFWRKSDQPVGIFVSLAMILAGTLLMDGALADWAAFYHPWLGPIVLTAQFVGFACLAVWYAFPDGRFVPHWTQWLALAWVLCAFGWVLIRATRPDANTLPQPWSSIPAVFLASVLFSMAYRYLSASNAAQKHQIRWVAAGAALHGIVYMLRLIPAVQAGPGVTLSQLAYGAALDVSSLIFAVCLGMAMLYSKPGTRPQATDDRLQRTEDRLEISEHRAQTAVDTPQTTNGRPQTKDEGQTTKDKGPQAKKHRPPKTKGKRKKK